MTKPFAALDPARLAALFRANAMAPETVCTVAVDGKTPPARMLGEHLGRDLSGLPVVSQQFPSWEHANVHLGIEACIAREDHSSTLIGAADPHGQVEVSLPALAGAGGRRFVKAAVQYQSIQAAEGQDLSCVADGLYLVSGPGLSVAVLVSRCRYGMLELGIQLQLMAPTREQAERFLREVRKESIARNIYRGRTVSVTPTGCGTGVEVEFLSLPRIEREEIILPDGLLDRIERPTVRFARHAERLRGAGRHLKRGILLYGPPGGGKTLTAMHLAGRMDGRTVFVLTGRGLGVLAQTCQMARALAPATLILEDVDLVAEERVRGEHNAVLFELLNAMDGIAEDSDILFLLTTNRPEILEPALSQRPGRVDQAIEIPLPDAACRRRLLALYGRKLEMSCRDLDRVIAQTEGVTASFIRELLRRATLIAAEEQEDRIIINDAHLETALDELLLSAGPLGLGMVGAGRGARREAEPGPSGMSRCGEGGGVG